MTRLSLFLILAALLGCGKVTAESTPHDFAIEGVAVLMAGGHKKADGKMEPAIIKVDKEGRVFCSMTTTTTVPNVRFQDSIFHVIVDSDDDLKKLRTVAEATENYLDALDESRKCEDDDKCLNRTPKMRLRFFWEDKLRKVVREMEGK